MLRMGYRTFFASLLLAMPRGPGSGRAHLRQANLRGPQRQQVQQVGRAERCPLLLAHEAALMRGIPLKRHQRHPTHHREALRPVALANRTTRRRRGRPMQLVLHRPMGANLPRHARASGGKLLT